MSDDDLVAHWQRVSGAVIHTRRRVERILEATGVPAQSFAVLHLLLYADDHRMPMSVLAREVSMTSGGFTKLADRMARDGLIDRRGSSSDRRVVNAMLTEFGLDTARQASRRYAEALRECILGAVSGAELAAAAAALRPLGAAGHEPVEPDESVQLQTQRDPAQPERRGRGRASAKA